MRTPSATTLLAALNPSPLFEAVAIFADRLVVRGDEFPSSEIDGAHTFAVPKRRRQMTLRFEQNAALPLTEVRN